MLNIQLVCAHENNIFLKSKSISTFNTMWITIQDLCVYTLNQEVNIKEFHVDFEISAHYALLNLYPHCKIVACTFHLAQS
jgi:hypothetical protein